MSARQFEGILIDFYGTVSSGDREAVEAVCRHLVDTFSLPVTARELAITWGERFFSLVERSNHDAFQTLYDCELGSLRETLAAFGEDSDPTYFLDELEAYWRNPTVFADAFEFLAGLNIPICCVSNADTDALLTAIEQHNLRFDAVVTSEAARCYKPDPGIFERAINILGIPADRAVHIGDSLHSDIEGAARLGIATVWLRREDRIHDIGKWKPDHTFSSLTDAGSLFVHHSSA